MFKTLPLQLPLVASASLIGIPYGQISSAETLLPSPTPSIHATDTLTRKALTDGKQSIESVPAQKADSIRYLTAGSDTNDTSMKIFVRQAGEDDAVHSGDEASDDPMTGADSDDADDEEEGGSDSDSASDDDDAPSDDGGQESEAEADSSGEESAGPLDDSGDEDFETPSEDSDYEPLVNTWGGTWHIDCLYSPEACYNACYYTNCMRGVKGDTNNDVYRVGYKDDTEDNRNRAGVTTDLGRPCSTGPFGQKFLDEYQFTDSKDATPQDLTLDTDEWPMATFLHEDINPVSLRCISATDNQNAGSTRNAFLYTGPKRQRLDPGTRLRVDFNFNSFDQTDDAELFEFLDVCRDTENGGWSAQTAELKCKNDGKQFHLEDYRGGKLWYLYDHEYHNSYKITGEDNVIHQYHVTLIIAGDKSDTEHEVEAEVTRYKSPGSNRNRNKGAFVLLAKGAQTMENGDTLQISQGLPTELKITKACGDNVFDFVYGDPKENRNRWFQFHSKLEGHKDFSLTKDDDGKYCVTKKEEKVKRTKGKDMGKDVLQTTLQCSFPGW